MITLKMTLFCFATGCRNSFLEVFDGKDYRMRYCGMLLPQSTLQYRSRSLEKTSKVLQGFDIKFEGMIRFLKRYEY